MERNSTNTRTEAFEFARRTRKNLEFIEEAKEKGRDVHPVTQLTLSLLGLIVFPKEKFLLARIEKKTLEDMKGEGWPTWKIVRDDEKSTKTLGHILRHLRNAVAHGRLSFITSDPNLDTSDSPYAEHVIIRVKDKPPGAKVNWCAEINGKDLRAFCLRLIEFIDKEVG
ncbi:hypothetical protein BH24DEI2_BH24DEI2_28730 [soil metagenome]